MIYIAGKFSSRKRLLQQKHRLDSLGFHVSSTWLEEPEGITINDLNNAERYEIAKRDVREVGLATMLVIDTLDGSDTCGRDVEFGVALSGDKYTVVIGPKRNIFHYAAAKHYDSWESFYEGEGLI